jgi:hypothetical protein
MKATSQPGLSVPALATSCRPIGGRDPPHAASHGARTRATSPRPRRRGYTIRHGRSQRRAAQGVCPLMHPAIGILVGQMWPDFYLMVKVAEKIRRFVTVPTGLGSVLHAETAHRAGHRGLAPCSGNRGPAARFWNEGGEPYSRAPPEMRFIIDSTRFAPGVADVWPKAAGQKQAAFLESPAPACGPGSGRRQPKYASEAPNGYGAFLAEEY